MSSEALHVAREKLSRRTLDMHYAITSLMEEFEAVDWYRQHAAMVLEWIRRNDPEADAQLREYLFKDGSIAGHEEQASETHGL